jgi:4a-hydroxytetrahydrobiopterin dehydratase
MSEQGWQDFLAAKGVDDWVVLHGGAMAVFRVRSLVEAARLAEAVAKVTGLEGSGVLLTVATASLTIRLTRDIWQLEPRHLELARAVSDAIDLGFWRAVLGYAPMADDNAVDPLGHGSTVWMQPLDAAKPLRQAMHLDVSVAREQVTARLQAALAAGGRLVDESHAPSHWTLADRAGNRVCICAWPDGSTPKLSDG